MNWNLWEYDGSISDVGDIFRQSLKCEEHMEAYLYVLTLTEFFLNQASIILCEGTVKIAPRDSFH